MKTTFDALPDPARLWIFTVDRPLSAADETTVLDTLHTFVDGWTSHARPVEGAVAVRDGRFIVVGAQIRGGDVSGCGTDDLFRAVNDTLATVGAQLAPPLSVAYREESGAVKLIERALLRTAVQRGEITATTPILDPALTTFGDLRAARFERPASETWLARYLAEPVRA